MDSNFIFGIVVFIVFVLVFVVFIFLVKFKLVDLGDIIIIINDDFEKLIIFLVGGKLFGVLVSKGIFVLLVCGGGGLCG